MVKKMIKLNKNTALVGMVIFLVTVTVVILYIGYTNRTSNDALIASVNGEPIQKKEFIRQLILERTNTIEYFTQKYNADISNNFWNRNFNGEVPIEYARKKALEECIAVKVKQILAKEKGLVDEISYQTFLEDLDKENKRRKDAIKDNQPIYGPIEYDENSYFVHVLSTLIIKTKDNLLEGEFKPTEIELRDYYEKVKDKFYQKEDFISFQLLYINYGKNGGEFTEADRNAAMNKMKEIKVLIDNGESFEDIVEMEPEIIKMEERTLNTDSASVYSKVEPLLYEVVKMMNSHETSVVLDEIMQRRVEVVTVLHKEGEGYKSFDDYKDSVLSNYIDEKYKNLIDKLIQESKVEINEREYKKIYLD